MFVCDTLDLSGLKPNEFKETLSAAPVVAVSRNVLQVIFVFFGLPTMRNELYCIQRPMGNNVKTTMKGAVVM